MTITVEQVGDVAIVNLGSWKSTTLAAWLDTEPFGLLKQGQRRFIFDLTDCPHLSSGILAELAVFYREARAAGASVTLAATRDQASLFKLTKLDQVFPIHPSAGEALASLGDSRKRGS